MSIQQIATPRPAHEFRNTESVPQRVPLRVLMIEDNEDDVAILLRLLRRGGYDPIWVQVQTTETLLKALREPWDIALSDYNMPQLDGLRALQTLRRESPNLPFVVISGSIGEEMAVQAIRAGANDYLMKTNLVRLVPVIDRELREASERRERATTGKALADLQEKFEVIFAEYLDVMMVLNAASGDILHVNQAAKRVTGYEPGLLAGQPFLSIWSGGEPRAVVTEMLAAVREDGSALRETCFTRLDGSIFPVDMQASMVVWGKGQAIIVTLRDVTERDRAEQLVADEKEQLAVTLRSIGEGVVTADTQGRLLLLNGVAEHMTGWTQAEAAGRGVDEILRMTYATGSDLVEDYIARVLQTGQLVEVSRDLVLRSREGRERLISLTAAPIRGQGGQIKGAVTIFRDATSEQKREEELLKASRLESVSLLAGGIAHDFNNILTAMLGHVAMAKNRTMTPEAAITLVEKACHYATSLTRQLLSFARDGSPNRRLDSLAEIVQEGVEFGLHGTCLRCAFDLPDNLYPVEVDRVQIHQVINNLVINAAQAALDNGMLRVSASNVTITREQPVATLPPGQYVQLLIEDNGSGISPEHLARIFDPYFTTKKNGNGLGLATCYSIIKKHGGLIRVESELRHGTTFAIYLPASGNAAPAPVVASAGSAALEEPVRPGPPAAAEPAAPGPKPAEAISTIQTEAPTGMSKYILFMDDEEVLQELVSAMLGYLGYEVVCAPNGEDAIEKYEAARAAGRPFSVVIVDLTVPGGMGGFEAVRRLRELDPGVKAVVSSGYSNDPILTDFRAHGFAGVIAKPYQMGDLDAMLQGIIGGTAGA